VGEEAGEVSEGAVRGAAAAGRTWSAWVSKLKLGFESFTHVRRAGS
jgi:hypothetical protein